MKKVLVGLFLTSLLVLQGCGNTTMQVRNATPVKDVPDISILDQEYLVQVGDTIRVTLRNFDDPADSDVTEVPVRPDGRVYVSLLREEILVAGYTPDQIRQNLIKQFSELVRQPILSVNIVRFAPRSVYVGGEINTVPDEMPFIRDMTALRAVTRTGWDVRRANLNNVVVIRRQGNGNKPIVMALRLIDAIRNIDPSQDITLKPNDIVVVPPKGIVVAGDYIAHINNLVPLPGVVNAVGAGYVLDRILNDDDEFVPTTTTSTTPGGESRVVTPSGETRTVTTNSDGTSSSVTTYTSGGVTTTTIPPSTTTSNTRR